VAAVAATEVDRSVTETSLAPPALAAVANAEPSAASEASDVSSTTTPAEIDPLVSTAVAIADATAAAPSISAIVETLCQGCTRGDGEDVMLLCDHCPHAWHIYCLTPPLPAVPAGDDPWFCPACVTKCSGRRVSRRVKKSSNAPRLPSATPVTAHEVVNLVSSPLAAVSATVKTTVVSVPDPVSSHHAGLSNKTVIVFEEVNRFFFFFFFSGHFYSLFSVCLVVFFLLFWSTFFFFLSRLFFF
jgi:hypothetical protein